MSLLFVHDLGQAKKKLREMLDAIEEFGHKL